MLNRNQAKAAAEAILEPKQRELSRKQAKKRQRQAYWRAHRQKGAAGLAGFCVGAFWGYHFLGEVYPWSIVGMGFGVLLATFFKWMGTPHNK